MTDHRTEHQTNLDTLAARYADLSDHIDQLLAARNDVIDQLRLLGPGKHPTTVGVTVTITPPSRRFNADLAWTMLNADQQAVCVGPIPAKIKSQLAPVLLEQCMEPGTGNPTVKVA